MKKTQIKKFIVGGILILFLAAGVMPAVAQTDTVLLNTITENVDFSAPILKENIDGSEIIVNEANGVLSVEGCPMLPVFSKTFEFPLGTKIVSVEVQPSAVQTVRVDKQIRPVPTKQMIGDQLVPVEGIVNEDIYASADLYPVSWYTISSGAGLNTDNEHTLFVTVRINPVRYVPKSQALVYSTHFTINMAFKEAAPAQTSSEMYSLVIIAPAEFSETLQPLVDHKNSYGVTTILVPLEEMMLNG
jgi:hypothetical protein